MLIEYISIMALPSRPKELTFFYGDSLFNYMFNEAPFSLFFSFSVPSLYFLSFWFDPFLA